MQDLRYAARTLRRTPGFALVATLCLAIGIGVNTAAFSLLNAIMFRAFPGVERQDQLVSVFLGRESEGRRSTASYGALADWEMLRTGIPAFSGIAAFGNLQLSVRIGGEAEAVRGLVVSSAFFQVLGTRPAVGGLMTSADDGVVLSYDFWKRAFAARPDIAGQAVTIGTRSFSIIGVAPEGFFGLYPAEVLDPDTGAPELFVPLAAAVHPLRLQVFGRLRGGATLAQAEAQAQAVAAQLAATYPVERTKAFAVLRAAGDPARDGPEVVTAMLFAMAVPALILLVACANLTNQLLARAVQRGREIAVRLSLGATRGRVVRQLLVETTLLAVIAGAIGVLLARWTLDALGALVLGFPFRIAIDVRVLAFTIGLALLAALAAGLAPALGATRSDLSSALRDGAPGGGYRRSRLRNSLVVVQVAASLALLALSSVFVRAAQQPPSAALEALAGRALLVSVNLDLLGFDSVGGRAYQAQVMERLAGLPGVAAVGLAPFAMFDMIGGQPITSPGQEPSFGDVAEVSGAWFDAVAIQPLRGRLFSAAERAAPPSVAVVDEEFARRWWGAADPLGRTLRIGPDSVARLVTVVGVIPTRQEVAYRQPEGIVVVPGTGQYNPRTYFYVRTSVAAGPMAATVRQAVRGLDPRVPILWVRTLEDVAASEGAPLTALASGLATLGAVALALAALGLFGVLSFLVAQRRYEIGVRVALGARRSDVAWLVVRQALGLAVGGVIAGTLLAVATVTLLRAVVFGLQPLDLPMFGGIAALMLLIALLASAVPARRAASVDPMRSLRAE